LKYAVPTELQQFDYQITINMAFLRNWKTFYLGKMSIESEFRQIINAPVSAPIKSAMFVAIIRLTDKKAGISDSFIIKGFDRFAYLSDF